MGCVRANPEEEEEEIGGNKGRFIFLSWDEMAKLSITSLEPGARPLVLEMPELQVEYDRDSS